MFVFLEEEESKTSQDVRISNERSRTVIYHDGTNRQYSSFLLEREGKTKSRGDNTTGIPRYSSRLVPIEMKLISKATVIPRNTSFFDKDIKIWMANWDIVKLK